MMLEKVPLSKYSFTGRMTKHHMRNGRDSHEELSPLPFFIQRDQADVSGDCEQCQLFGKYFE
jgi:hypothetical protein